MRANIKYPRNVSANLFAHINLQILCSTDVKHLWFADVVPLCTLNLQKGVPPGQVIPDAWHHQVVYGIGPKGG